MPTRSAAGRAIKTAPSLQSPSLTLGQDHATHAADPRRLTREDTEPTTAAPAQRGGGPEPGIYVRGGTPTG